MVSRSPYFEGLVITAIVFGFIGFLRLVTVQTHFLDPFNNGVKDYEVTDIVFSRLRDPDRVQRETKIVLVHVDAPERAEMARLIKRISARQPKAIGLDILFAGPREREGDSLLATVLRETPNVVIAGNLAPYVDSLQGIPAMIASDTQFSNHAETAYTNFLAGTDKTVRLFTPRVNTLDGEEHLAFAVALARYYDPNSVGRLLWRGQDAERINYFGDYRSFLRIRAEDVLTAPDEALALFRDRIVMVGFADSRDPDAPLEDRYFTPLNHVYTGRSVPDMYGMVIHANILSMILNETYIHEFPRWLTTLLALVFGYFNVLIIHRIYHQLPDTFHGVTRILQLVELLVCFFIVAFLFYVYRLKVDFSLGFLALILAYDLVMIYESLIKKRIPYLKNL